MEESISKFPKLIILCDREPVGCISCKELEKNAYEIGCLCIVPKFQKNCEVIIFISLY